MIYLVFIPTPLRWPPLVFVEYVFKKGWPPLLFVAKLTLFKTGNSPTRKVGLWDCSKCPGADGSLRPTIPHLGVPRPSRYCWHSGLWILDFGFRILDFNFNSRF